MGIESSAIYTYYLQKTPIAITSKLSAGSFLKKNQQCYSLHTIHSFCRVTPLTCCTFNYADDLAFQLHVLWVMADLSKE